MVPVLPSTPRYLHPTDELECARPWSQDSARRLPKLKSAIQTQSFRRELVSNYLLQHGVVDIDQRADDRLPKPTTLTRSSSSPPQGNIPQLLITPSICRNVYPARSVVSSPSGNEPPSTRSSRIRWRTQSRQRKFGLLRTRYRTPAVKSRKRKKNERDSASDLPCPIPKSGSSRGKSRMSLGGERT